MTRSSFESIPEAAEAHFCDTTHCTAGLVSFLGSYFAAKSAHDFPRMNEHFHPDKTVYGDAVAGWIFRSNPELVASWQHMVPGWPQGALFYPTRIIGDRSGAMIFVTDTPEMLGREIRGIAAVDMENGLVVRWIDYWDSRPLGAQLIGEMHIDDAKVPADLGEDTVDPVEPGRVHSVCHDLHAALVGADADGAGAMFATDGVFEDMTLRTAVRGRAAITRYLRRAVHELPYGPGAAIRHILGSVQGGGYEWRADGKQVPRGVNAVELDDSGAISYFAAVWDGSLLSDRALAACTAHAFDR